VGFVIRPAQDPYYPDPGRATGYLAWGAGLALAATVGSFLIRQWGVVEDEHASRLWMVASLAGLALFTLALWGLTGASPQG